MNAAFLDLGGALGALAIVMACVVLAAMFHRLNQMIARWWLRRAAKRTCHHILNRDREIPHHHQ